MKPNEARKLNTDEIYSEVDKRRKELLELRIQASVGQASNPKRIGTAKREIARLLTIATEQRAGEATAETTAKTTAGRTPTTGDRR